jgi:hypothetical protein
MRPGIRVLMLWLIGALLAVPCLTVAIVSLLRTFLEQVDASNVFVRPLYRLVVALVNTLDEHIPFFEALWYSVPVFDSTQLLTRANVPFALLCIGFGVGMALVRRGSKLFAQLRASPQPGSVYFVSMRQSIFDAIVAGVIATVVGGVILYLIGMN